MNIWNRILTIFVITLTSVGCDQSTKIIASEYLPKNQTFSFMNDVLRIGYTENIGAFLGLDNTLSDSVRFWVLVVFVGVVLLGLLTYLVLNAKQQQPSLIAFSLIFSGGLSNFYDRVINSGAVVDFINIGVGSLRTGVFNVADVAIMLGMFSLLFVANKDYVMAGNKKLYNDK